jgi:hypothetical protein
MLKLLRLLFAIVVIAIACLVPAALLFAQVVADPITPPDWKAQAALALTVLAPLFLPFVVYGVRLLIPKIPRVALPVVALALGFGVDALGTYVTGHAWSPITGAALGAGTVLVREVYNTLQQHGLSA